MSDALRTDQRYCIVNVLYDHNREGLGIKTEISLPPQRIAALLEKIAHTRGYPK